MRLSPFLLRDPFITDNYYSYKEPLVCRNNTFINNGICLPFNTTSDCLYPIISNLSACLSCPVGKNYLIEDQFICVSTCPDGYLPNFDLCSRNKNCFKDNESYVNDKLGCIEGK